MTAVKRPLAACGRLTNERINRPRRLATWWQQGALIDMTKRNWTITVATLLLAIVLFGGGVIVGQRLMFRAFAVQLRGVQATLLFDRIVQEREIKTLLARGCVNVAIGEISNNELADRKTLLAFIHVKLDRDAIAYINKRDSNILSELDSPTSSFTNTWPGCEK
jgi:hypothetical protein